MIHLGEYTSRHCNEMWKCHFYSSDEGAGQRERDYKPGLLTDKSSLERVSQPVWSGHHPSEEFEVVEDVLVVLCKTMYEC